MHDDAFDALADERRRELLVALLDQNPLGESTLSGGDSDSAPPPAQRRQLFIMRHVHLPKLAEYGYVEWDEDAREVTRGPRFEEIRPLVAFVAGRGEAGGSQSHADGDTSLSEAQQDVLVTAVEMGYFGVPRGTSLAALADAAGMSDVEASQRLREGIATVLGEYFTEKPHSGD